MTIIIPVYNSANTISRLVNQIIAQRFQSYELILVDDGSTDSTAEVIDKFHEKYPEHIKVIHQVNGGVSVARNSGIKAANGRYITFIDADDEIMQDYLNNLMSAIWRDRSDIAISGYTKVPSGNVQLENGIFTSSQYDTVLMTRDIGVAFCKIYDADIIRNNNILFPEGMKLSEDAVFYYRYLRFSRKCSFIDKTEYIYYAPVGDKKYNLSINDELVGLCAISDALISLMQSLSLKQVTIERLRRRIILSLNRVLYAICAQPRNKRSYYLKKIDWPKLAPYIKTDRFTQFLVNKRCFLLFEITRTIRSALLRQQISDYIR